MHDCLHCASVLSLIATHNSFLFFVVMHPKTWKILISSMCEMWRAYTKYLLCRIRAHNENRGYYRKYRKSGSRLCTITTLRFSNLRNSSDALNRYVTISDRWDVV